MATEAYVGAPGTGKTTLALAHHPIVLSPWADGVAIRVSPTPSSLGTALSIAFARGCTAILVDEIEAYLAVDPALLPLFRNLWNQSRHYGVTVGIASKRPARVPLEFFACADTLYLFRIQHPDDARTFSAWVDPRQLLRLPDYEYLVIRRGQPAGRGRTKKP